MKRIRRIKGFTLAETLIVVAIITILSGVSFIAVQNHMRSLAQLERDGIAKEIFVAAQNHLTMAEHEGYLGLSEYGTPENEEDGIYYFIGSGAAFSGSNLLKVMLPFGAVDETVRLGGSYIIRYQRDTGRVLDVFFSWPNQRFPHTFGDELGTLMQGYTGEGNTNRRNYTDGSVIGWYGGEAAQTLATLSLDPPVLEVINQERLQVIVKDPNYGKTGASLQLIIKGVSSQKEKAIPLDTLSSTGMVSVATESTAGTSQNVFTVILDDITSPGKHFAELFEDFVPGENISIQAIAYSNDALSNIAYSGEKKTNSLFADLAEETSLVGAETVSKRTAAISNIRHLENLDVGISKASYEELNITKAKQTTDLNWEDFKEKIGDNDNTVIYKKGAEDGTIAGGGTKPGCYMPVSPENPLAYDGANHRISNILVNIDQNAGVFGEMVDKSSISDLLVYQASITASSGNAGGLIGSMSGTTVERCAANGTVNAIGAAGGLIGSADGGSTGSTVTACYSAGHTDDGSYEKWIEAKDSSNNLHGYDVTGATAGGLIGIAESTAIEFSYSTCSATGTTVGGLIGSGSGAVTKCYATGLVKGTGDSPAEGAFIGNNTGSSISGSHYYMIINERKTEENGNTSFSYLDPLGAGTSSKGILALDRDAEEYETFVSSAWADAVPNDESLVTYYQGTYPFPTVAQLGAEVSGEDHFINTHYGDWPAPEIFVINN